LITGTPTAEKVSNENCFLLPHLTTAFALPGETRNRQIASFYINNVCCFANISKKLENARAKYELMPQQTRTKPMTTRFKTVLKTIHTTRGSTGTRCNRVDC